MWCYKHGTNKPNLSRVSLISTTNTWANRCIETKWFSNNVQSKCWHMILLFAYFFVCVWVCMLWACASLGLCLLRTTVCRTVILSNGLSTPADVLVFAPQLHPTCFHAVQQCSYILFLCSCVVGGSGGGGGRFLLCIWSCSSPPLCPEYCSTTLAILGPEMSPVG